jgi:hypothetical protein
MKTFVAVVGLLVLGAVGWAVFGDQITGEAEKVKTNVQYEVHDKAKTVNAMGQVIDPLRKLTGLLIIILRWTLAQA